MLLCELIVEDSEEHDWEGGEDYVEHLVDPLFVESLASEGRDKAEPELGDHEQDVFVEDVDHQVGVATVALSPMHKQKSLQELKLADGVVSCSGGLLSFEARDAYSHVGLGDHVDIVGAVPNGQGASSGVLLPNELHYLCLLLGRHPAS